jgi:hypothetical protein
MHRGYEKDPVINNAVENKQMWRGNSQQESMQESHKNSAQNHGGVALDGIVQLIVQLIVLGSCR